MGNEQIASLLEYPPLLENPLVSELYPKDVIERAKELQAVIGSVGAYTGSKGLDSVRKHVAQWLEGTLPTCDAFFSNGVLFD